MRCYLKKGFWQSSFPGISKVGMDLAHILEELAYDMGGDLPREAIEAAIAKRNAITPHLLAILSDATQRIDEVIEDDNYQGHIYAMYLLAQFREKEAYPLLIELFSFPCEIPHAIAGDVLTEDLSRILASTCDGETRLLKQLVENPSANEYVRAACQEALVLLVGCGFLKREAVIAYFHELLTSKLEKVPSFAWDYLIACCCILYPDELHRPILQAFEDELINENFISLQDVAATLTLDKTTHLYQLYHDAELIDDTIVEMEKWVGDYSVQ